MTAAETGQAAVILDHVWVGAGIHIHPGGSAEAREPFLPWRELPDDPDAVFALLSWHARLAPLAGRETDNASLLQWARQGRNARIRLLTGPGGVGKSRLAAEVADALRADGWTAGFVRPDDPIVVPLRRAGLFLVVDYPEEHPDEVSTLLRDVASRELRDIPVRLLVLSRQGGDRWFGLVESAHVGELIDAREIGLGGLAAAEPEALFIQSLRRLCDHYLRPMPAISAAAVASWVALNPALHGLPLLLTAAAIHAFLSPDAALGIDGAAVVQALADRERARLDNAGRAAGLGPRSASRVVALAAVPGSIEAALLRRLADPALEIGLPAPDRVVDAASSLPWWHSDHVPSPQPDIMAAALLCKILSERSDKAAEWLWAVIEGGVAAPLIDRLGRLAFDAMTVTGSATGLTRHLRAILDDPSRASKLELLSYESNLPFGLASFAADISRTLLATVTDEAKRAEYLNNLSNHLGDAGDRTGALVVIREAVEIRRRLVQANSVRFSPDLAMSLNNISNCLSEVGNRAGALGAVREAVEILRRLVQHDRARFAPDLALSLSNLSGCLSDAGDGRGSLKAISEAVGIYRQLAHDNAARFAFFLAGSLNNLSLGMHYSGDSIGALTVIREAVDTFRRLAQMDPARFLPGLARSLNNLSVRLGDVGDGTGALAFIREAVSIYLQLAQDNPARFMPDLAVGLGNLAIRLSEAGAGEEARKTICQAVEIQRGLTQSNPERFQPDLAESLYNFSLILRDSGDSAGSLKIIRESAEIFRRLTDGNLARFVPLLVRTLRTLEALEKN